MTRRGTFLLLSLLFSRAALALDVSGPINATTTWTAAQSPYHVTGSVTVQNGATLIIEPGALVLMGPGTNLTVSNGALRALGTGALPIVITAESDTAGGTPVPGSWGVLRFANGTNDSLTALEHAEVRYGQGVVIESAAPAINFVTFIRNSGAAVSADLASSPAGQGLQAIENGVDGVLVPPGEITGAVRWGLRGIPYVVGQGLVSVGRAPSLVSAAPSQIAQGQTVAVTVSGTRLTGLQRARFDNPGLSGAVVPGGGDASFIVNLTAAPDAPLGPSALEVLVAAGEARLAAAVTVVPPKPPITVDGVTPGSLRRGESKAFQATGQNLAGATVTTAAAGLTISNVSTTATSVGFTLAASAAAALGSQALIFANPASATGTATAAVTVNDLPPQVVTSPAPVAVPPDNAAHLVKLRLSHADVVDHAFTLSTGSTAIATVSPPSATIPAGQTETNLAVTGKAVGETALTIVSPTLGTTTTTIFVTTEFSGLNTSFAPPLGVEVLAPAQPPPLLALGVTSAPAGVVVGSYLADVSPRVLTIGTGPQPLVISGAGLGAVTAVALSPPDGVTTGAPAVSPDGSQVTVPVTVAADAPTTIRRVVLTGPGPLPARPDADRIKIVRPLPVLDWISPLLARTGASGLTLTITGRNFQDLQGVAFVPDDGLTVGTPSATPDGARITVTFSVAADAPVGPRAVTVTTLGGTSPATPSPVNTVEVVSGATVDVTPVTAVALGVTLDQATPPATQAYGVWTGTMGVVVGSAATAVSPESGAIGTSVSLAIQGAGLGGVTAVQLSPATGLTVGAPQVAGDGRSLTVSLGIAADAPQTVRAVQVLAGSQPVAFQPPAEALFRVTPPAPRIDWISPLVVQTGAAPVTLTVAGANFQNASQVSVFPPDDVTVSPPSVNAAGTSATATIAASAGAQAGPRAVTITTLAGETTRTPGPENTLTVAPTAGTSYGPVVSPLLGVTVEEPPSPPPPVSYGPVAAALVGVQLGPEPPEAGLPLLVSGGAVGVALGPVATALSPAGLLSGQSATLTVSGAGLDAVTSVAISPSTGITLGTPAANAGGTQLSIPITADAAAPGVARQLALTSASGAVRFATPSANRLAVVPALPVLSSIEPILGTQGQVLSLLIRGSNLQYATGVAISPAAGVTFTPTFTVDAAAGTLTITLAIEAGAPPGPRVIQVVTPAGPSSAEPSAANTFTIRSP